MRRLAHIVAFLGLLSLTACSGSKAFTKKGDKLMAAGDYRMAADLYYVALQKNSANINARVGMSKVGQQVLNDHLEEFFRAYSTDDHKEAVYAYLSAKEYSEKLDRYRIDLRIPSHYESDYREMLSTYLDAVYQKGEDALNEGDFELAETHFAEISDLDPSFRDAEDLHSFSVIEPKYIEGNNLIELDQYRKAFYKLDQIYRMDPSYKDVAQLRSLSLEKGRFTVAIVNDKYAASSYRAASEGIEAYLISAISNSNDPFLKVVDRDNLDRILKEQELALSGIFSESAAAQAGELIGADAIVSGKVLRVEIEENGLKKTRKKGFEKYTQKVVNKETEETSYITKYKPVYYDEYYGRNSVLVSFQFKITSLRTGEILMTDVTDRSLVDEAYFASMQGNYNNVYPAAANGQVNTNFQAKNQLNRLFKGKQSLVSANQLASTAFEQIAKEVSYSISDKIASLE